MDIDGKERLQILAPAEPLLPGNKSIERAWSPLWSLYRAEKNPQTGAASQSLLWNFWRRDATKDTAKNSFCFGLVRTRRTQADLSWRFFWMPFNRATNAPAQADSLPALPPRRGDFIVSPVAAKPAEPRLVHR